MSSLTVIVVFAGDPRQKYSFSRVLSDYEHWVQNVSEHTPWITCRDQNSFMSEYLFETDKIEGAPHTRGDNDDDDGAVRGEFLLARCSVRDFFMTPKLKTSPNLLNRKWISELMRIGSLIIFHLREL